MKNRENRRFIVFIGTSFMLGIFKENETNIFNVCTFITFYTTVTPLQTGADIAYLVVEKAEHTILDIRVQITFS
jgi:hypothetical protein